MKKFISLINFIAILLSFFALPTSATAKRIMEFEKRSGWNIAADVNVEKDLTISVILERTDSDTGVFFYSDDKRDTYFSVKIRWASAERTDFYVCRTYEGEWEGFLISEEYQKNKKDCYVSTDEWWSTAEDPSMKLDIMVVGDMLTVTMTGTVSGNSGTLNYDLTKPAYLDGEYNSNNALLPKTGKVGVCSNSSRKDIPFKNFIVEDTEERVINLHAEYLTDIAYSGESWWGCGVGYPRIILLQHSQLGQNNVLLATSEEATAGLEAYKPGYPLYRSIDQGKTWTQINFVQDPTDGINSEWQPMLFELPSQCGNYPKGTVFLAACSVDPAHSSTSAIQIYASLDGGVTFSDPITVATGGGIDEGVWEPFLIQLDDGRLVCFYSDDSDDENIHSQKIVYKVSNDGINWGEPVDVVASKEPTDRPGMPVVTRLGDGTYFMVYEIVNNETYNGNPITYKTSADGLDWGDPADTGTIIVSTNGKSLGSAPYCAWTPLGGDDGTIIVSGTFMREGKSSTGTDYFISMDKGETWETVPHVIPYSTKIDHGGYSPEDKNIENHSKLVCTMVEWENGAADLPENDCTFKEFIPHTTTMNGSSYLIAQESEDVNTSESNENDRGSKFPIIPLLAVTASAIAIFSAVFIVFKRKHNNK